MCEPRNINKVNSYPNWLIYIGLCIKTKVPTLTGDSVQSVVAMATTTRVICLASRNVHDMWNIEIYRDIR